MKKRNRFGHWLKTVSFILTFLEFYQLLDTLGKFLEHIGFGRVFFFKRLNALPAELIKDLLNLFDDARTPTIRAKRQSNLVFGLQTAHISYKTGNPGKQLIVQCRIADKNIFGIQKSTITSDTFFTAKQCLVTGMPASCKTAIAVSAIAAVAPHIES